MVTKTMKIAGMADAHGCVRVEQALNTVPNVSATVDFTAQSATIHAEPQVRDSALRQAVEDTGCQVLGIE